MIELKRIYEAATYINEYAKPSYRMGEQRRIDVERLLSMTQKGSYLDVSTGRGEALAMADRLGFAPVMGTETVPELLNDRVLRAYSISLPFPDKSFDVVSCLDVMEHLIDEDLVPTIKELCRVARNHVIVSWSEIFSSEWGGGRDLHISKRSAKDAHALLVSAAPGWTIRPDGTAGGSPVFRMSPGQ